MPSKKLKLCIWLYVLWSVPVISFSLSPGYISYFWEVTVALIGSILILVRRIELSTHAFPFVAFLSPLILDVRILGFGYADFFALFISIVTLLKIRFHSNSRLSNDDSILMLCLFLALFSYILSGHYIDLALGVVNVTIICVIYLRARLDIETSDDIRLFLLSLVVASGFVSILTIRSFQAGVNLNDFIVNEVFNDVQQIYDYSADGVVPKASFFYPNVFYITGIGLISALYLAKTSHFAVIKIFCVTVVAAIFLSLIVLFNKTAFVSLAIIFLIYIFFLLMHGSFKYAFVLSALLLGFGVMLLEFTSMFPQIHTIANLSSLEARSGFINSLLAVYSSEPLRLITGFGPESLIRLGSDIPIIMMAKSSNNAIEGTIDSAHLSFLFEFGIVVLFAYHWYGFKLFWKLSHAYHSVVLDRDLFVLCMLIMAYVYIGAFSQIIGLSKTGWIIAQVFALIPISLKNKT